MGNNFIASFHFETNKETPEWCSSAIDSRWFNSNLKGLLDGKNTLEIEQYKTGNIDLTPFKMMYKSI